MPWSVVAGQPLTVLGVPGSPGWQYALDFATAEAISRGAEVRAVRTWEFPVAFGAGVVVPEPTA